MSSSNAGEQEFSYVVVCQAQSGASFRENEAITIHNYPSSIGPVSMVFKTNYSDEGFEILIPRQFYVEIKGNASAIEEAIDSFWNAANIFTPIIALCTNAYIGDLQVELAFDVTPELNKHDFFQSMLPKPRGIPPRTRRVDIEATMAFVQALSRHSRSDRIHRATVYYRLALAHWKPGDEILSHHYLWSGIEALTPVALNTHLETTGLNHAQLKKVWEVDKLDPAVRERLIFQGDEDCYHKARKARVHFVHAVTNFDKIRQLIVDVRVRTAEYLRTAILELVGLEHPYLNTLQSFPYNAPAEHFPYTTYIRGKLVGQPKNFALEGYKYPWFDSYVGIKSVSKSADNVVRFTVEPKFTARFGEHVVLQELSYELWAPNPFKKEG